jgi:hypothetical protein
VDPKAVLDNIVVARVFTHEHQMQMLINVCALMVEQVRYPLHTITAALHTSSLLCLRLYNRGWLLSPWLVEMRVAVAEPLATNRSHARAHTHTTDVCISISLSRTRNTQRRRDGSCLVGCVDTSRSDW